MRKPAAALLADKVAVITGGGGAVGTAIARTFAAYGAATVIAEADEFRAAETVTAISDRGGRAFAVVADVGEPEDVDVLVDATLTRFGHVDILVNTGGQPPSSSDGFLAGDHHEWYQLYRSNLEPFLLCTQAFAFPMVEHGGGSIINVALVGPFNGIGLDAVHRAFEGGVLKFSESLAVELARDGVRVNAIAGDVVEASHTPYSFRLAAQERIAPEATSSVGRFATPADVADVALFLASDLSVSVTGVTMRATCELWPRGPDSASSTSSDGASIDTTSLS